MSYIEALFDLNIESFAKPIDVKILTYEIENSKLIRLLHPVIIVHPHIEWNSLFSSLIISPTPMAIRDGSSIRIMFDNVEGQRRNLETEAIYDAYYLDPLSLALIVPNSDVHRILSPLGERPLKSRLKLFIPCTSESYILTEESLDAITYWDHKVIVKKPHFKILNTLHPYLGIMLNAVTIYNDSIVIVSDGIYGSMAITNDLVKYLDGAFHLYLLNDFSIVMTLRNHNVIIEPRYGVAKILPRGLVPYVKEGPYIIGLFKPNNYIVLYHVSKNELQNLFPSTCKLLAYNLDSNIIIALCTYTSRHTLIAIKPSGEGLVVELPSKPLNAELIDDILMLSYTDRSEVYRISQNLDRIELLCVTKPLYNCRRLDSKRVVCVDSFGRLVVVNTKRICDRPKAYFLRSKKPMCIELEDASKYVSILGTSISNPAVRRLSLTRTIIEFENPHYQRLQLTISGTLYDTSLLLNSLQPMYAKYNSKNFLSSNRGSELILIKSNTKLYIYNNSDLSYCIFSPQGINYIEREFLAIPQNSVSEVYRVHRVSSNPQIEFWKKVNPTTLRYVELPNNIELVLDRDLICASTNLSINDRWYRLEVELICEEGIYTLRDRCISTNLCRNLLASLICIVLDSGQRHCIPVSTSPRAIIVENENIKLRAWRILNNIYMTIPRNCVLIDSVSLIINESLIPVLMLNIINRCHIPITMVSAYGSSIQQISLEPYQSMRVCLPVDSLTKLFKKPMIVVFELGKPKTYVIDMDLKHIFTLAHSIALKLSLLLGVRRWSY